jgi:hypothetical protein
VPAPPSTLLVLVLITPHVVIVVRPAAAAQAGVQGGRLVAAIVNVGDDRGQLVDGAQGGWRRRPGWRGLGG